MKYRIIEQLKNVQAVQLSNRSKLLNYTTLSETKKVRDYYHEF